MLEEVKKKGEGILAPLLTGILDDIQLLLRQELALAKCEVRQETAKLKASLISFGVSLASGFTGVLLGSFSLAHAFAYYNTGVPLWLWLGFVACAALIVSAFYIIRSIGLSNSLHIIPEQTIESIKENAQCIKERA